MKRRMMWVLAVVVIAGVLGSCASRGGMELSAEKGAYQGQGNEWGRGESWSGAHGIGTMLPARVQGAEGSGDRLLGEAAAFGEADEVWVIEKAKAQVPAAVGKEDREVPGEGTLMGEENGKWVAVPLKHTEVAAEITGFVASVEVTQRFFNPSSGKIEAVYEFPLPANAGISEFVMTVGERRIRGIIRERAEAEKIFTEARQQGYVASLMTQERPNVFTQRVANIEPGKAIDIEVKYFHTLSYQDGWYEWVFPMVVGPGYNPAGSKDGVGAVARGDAGRSGQATEVQYLRPKDRSGHDIGLTVKLDAGMSVGEVVSVNHLIKREKDGENGVVVALDGRDTIPNKDFVLRWKVAGKKVRSGLFVQRDKDGKGGYFTLMIIPPESLKSLPRRAVEMVFVVDTSGSMSGQPIAQAKAAVDVALGKMAGDDTFQVVKFDSTAEQMSAMPLMATQENIESARRYVKGMEGGGGTEMLAGINKALGFPHDENRTRVVAFLTDGFIGNEIEVLKGLHAQLEGARVFSFGVGTSVNRYLLDAMAVMGHGSAAYLSLNEPAKPVMDAYFERISHPALANVSINWGSMHVTDVYPKRLPELFVGRPIVVTGRFTGEIGGDVTVSGKVGKEELHFGLPAEKAVTEHAGIATVWARMKIADLEKEGIFEGRDISGDVRGVALSHGIMSAFTSFVAVDSSKRTEGDHGTSVAVPVPVPEGVRYETTVNEGGVRKE